MIDLKEAVLLVPTWITARHAVGAANSIRKYYPDLPVYFVDDKFTPDQEGTWKQIYTQGYDSYSNEPELLIDYPNSCYIRREHLDNESDGHGRAITHAMQFIHSKWVIHISTDVRVIKEGVLEFMFDGIDDEYCGTGDDWSRDGPPALGSWLFAFRGDLYHKFDMNFFADRSKRWDIGCTYYKTLIDKGYKFANSKGIMSSGYIIHLGSSRKRAPEQWEKYY